MESKVVLLIAIVAASSSSLYAQETTCPAVLPPAPSGYENCSYVCSGKICPKANATTLPNTNLPTNSTPTVTVSTITVTPPGHWCRCPCNSTNSTESRKLSQRKGHYAKRLYHHDQRAHPENKHHGQHQDRRA